MPWMLLLLLVTVLYIIDVYALLRLSLQGVQWVQVYTLLTAHWVHINFRHYLHNVTALIIIMLLLAPTLDWRRWLFALIISSLLISALLLLWPPASDNYAGLSGLLHGLFVAGCISLWREARLLALVLMVMLAGKLLMEFIFDAGLLHTAGFTVVKIAHLYGVLGGLLSAALLHLAHKQAQR